MRACEIKIVRPDLYGPPCIQMIPTKTADLPIHALKRPILISLMLTLEKCYAILIFYSTQIRV